MNNEQAAPSTKVERLTDWKKEPTVMDLKADLDAARPEHDAKIQKINKWNDVLNVQGQSKPPHVKGRSSVQPRLVRRQAEWRYSALTEPFLSNQKLFSVSPVTYEDKAAAVQNELVLNWQFRTKLNRIKLVDDMVRSTVDDGTCILRVGWENVTVKVKEEVPTYTFYSITDQESMQMLQEALQLREQDPRAFDEQVAPEWQEAVKYFDETQQPVFALVTGTSTVMVDKVLVNRPTVTVCEPANVIIDPSCGGDASKALFASYSFETNKAELLKQGDRYKNLNAVNWENNAPLTQQNHETKTPTDFQFRDASRKKVVAEEYWGFYDIDGSGTLVPIVATWIGDVMIRLEENPFPDQQIPFVIIPYLPVKRDMYGETDAEFLEDNQKIMGALMRGLIDSFGRSANAQQGIAKGMLDALNRRRYDNGQDYEFNPQSHPNNGIHEHKYPEIPQSAVQMITMMNQDAESLSGTKTFSGGLSGEAYGDVAAGIRGMLDASAKREMAILRRLADGMSQAARKIMSMNAVFMSEEEIIRVTNEEFVSVKREDLPGNFDLIVDISTAEIDNAKSQDLGYILQTIGPKVEFGFVKRVIAEIIKLKRMPDLAKDILNYEPQPNPHQIEMEKLELELKRKEIQEIESKIALNLANASKAKTEKDLNDLNYVEQETGTKHARDMDKQAGQARGNQALEVTKALVKGTKEGERSGNVEAAIGYNALTSATLGN
jgi:hypothetical protein